MHRLRVSLPLLITLLACAWPAMAHAVTFGATVDGDFNNYQRGLWSLTQVQTSLQNLHKAGATVAQTGSDWIQTEAKRPVYGHHRYNWSYADTIARALAMAHLRWEPQLDYTPKWAQEHIRPARNGRGLVSYLSPANYNNYGIYVAAFARRYGRNGSFWRMRVNRRLPREPVTSYGIWNEPDVRWTWGPDVDLQHYAKLYKVAYTSIKRVDRHASVVTAGLGFDQSSLPRLLKAFEGIRIDAMGIHAYGRNASATIASGNWIESQMVKFGRRRTPLIANEFGFTSIPRTFQSVPKRSLQSDVRQSIAGLSRIKQVTQVIPFEWTDTQWGLNTGGLAAGIKQARARR